MDTLQHHQREHSQSPFCQIVCARFYILRFGERQRYVVESPFDLAILQRINVTVYPRERKQIRSTDQKRVMLTRTHILIRREQRVKNYTEPRFFPKTVCYVINLIPRIAEAEYTSGKYFLCCFFDEIIGKVGAKRQRDTKPTFDQRKDFFGKLE